MKEHYTTKTGVILEANIKLKVKKIADKYYSSTQKGIVITSGKRTSKSQAEAMYGKLVGGDKLAVYKNRVAAQEIKKSYDDAVTAKKLKPQVIQSIKSTIDSQILKKVYISKHLRKGAIDVRSRDMTPNEKIKFKTAALGVATKVILEVTPPHFHLQF
ncbi:MAG: hypothetical protein HRT55_09940 [Colwellia sp.]|uniref:hypothetical protein n=1 Tax=Colwellia sp. TaxID=56799 RepID=UPI0025BE3F7D|nr:hypothetical protein [Colwellia sp.]NQZ26623.1 hypothetical protein [Colwellia sp.]